MLCAPHVRVDAHVHGPTDDSLTHLRLWHVVAVFVAPANSSLSLRRRALRPLHSGRLRHAALVENGARRVSSLLSRHQVPRFRLGHDLVAMLEVHVRVVVLESVRKVRHADRHVAERKRHGHIRLLAVLGGRSRRALALRRRATRRRRVERDRGVDVTVARHGRVARIHGVTQQRLSFLLV